MAELKEIRPDEKIRVAVCVLDGIGRKNFSRF